MEGMTNTSSNNPSYPVTNPVGKLLVHTQIRVRRSEILPKYIARNLIINTIDSVNSAAIQLIHNLVEPYGQKKNKERRNARIQMRDTL